MLQVFSIDRIQLVLFRYCTFYRSDSDTTSIIGSDKENRHQKVEEDSTEEVTLRRAGGKASNANSSPLLNSSELAAKNLKNKELQASIALRKKTRKRTRKFVIDGVVVTTTTSKVRLV